MQFMIHKIHSTGEKHWETHRYTHLGSASEQYPKVPKYSEMHSISVFYLTLWTTITICDDLLNFMIILSMQLQND